MRKDPEHIPPIKEGRPHEFLRTHSISGRSSSRKVAALIDSMRNAGWTGSPVVVIEIAEEKYILDGHHRIYAARAANIMVQYRTIDIAVLAEFSYDTIDQVIQAHAEAGVNRIRHR